MKNSIIIDIFSILGKPTGIGRYTYEILSKLSDDSFEKFYYGGYTSRDIDSFKFNTKIDYLLRYTKRAIELFLKNTLSVKFDLYWQPNYIPLKNIRAKRIVSTVHDFSWEKYPEYHPKDRIDYFKTHFYKNIVRCDKIITGSHFIKNEILERLPEFKDRVEVIYYGYNDSIFKPVANKKKKYILYVGTLEPRKNLIVLLNAYLNLSIEIKKEYKLVLSGSLGWKNDDILNIINKNQEFITYLGYLPDEQIAKLYSEATLFVYPSVYEGFGLPPIEAMACGTPVITTKGTTMEEICKNSALYFDPDNIEELSHNIQKLIYDEQLRTDMIKRGFENIQKYNWSASAEKHATFFRSII